ncbi:MAG TPA: FHA domain-containing protein [Ktedonobacterales bacterium]|nr:FHA domain-containing protein [Ktedonobacterales bacterium]
MDLTSGYAILPVIAAGGLGGPVLVAIGGLVVIVAILLVFVMVLRSNGDAKKTSRGIGYDANQGPYGQSRAPVSQPNRSRQQAAWGDDYGAQPGPASRPGAGPAAASDWASYGNPGGQAPANAGRGGAQGGWGSPSGANWGEQQTPQWGGPPESGNQPPQWGAQPAAQAPGGWGDPSGRNDWNQQPGSQQGWNAPAQQGWDQQAPQGGQGWNNAPASAPAAGPQNWGAPAPAGAYGGKQDYGNGAYAEDQRTYVVRPQTGQGEPKLVVSEGKEPGRNYELRKDYITIGRSRDSDVFLEDLAVSRTHTTINRQPNGRYLLRDENSANGTLVNGQRVSEHMLEDGDKIQVGQTLLVFVYR